MEPNPEIQIHKYQFSGHSLGLIFLLQSIECKNLNYGLFAFFSLGCSYTIHGTAFKMSQVSKLHIDLTLSKISKRAKKKETILWKGGILDIQ